MCSHVKYPDGCSIYSQINSHGRAWDKMHGLWSAALEYSRWPHKYNCVSASLADCAGRGGRCCNDMKKRTQKLNMRTIQKYKCIIHVSNYLPSYYTLYHVTQQRFGVIYSVQKGYLQQLLSQIYFPFLYYCESVLPWLLRVPRLWSLGWWLPFSASIALKR